jgi:hypothetical protein
MRAQPGNGGLDHLLESLRVPLVTVASSSVAASADKEAITIVLKTKECGAIGFQVTIGSCAALRCQIAIAEILLHQKPRKPNPIGEGERRRTRDRRRRVHNDAKK